MLRRTLVVAVVITWLLLPGTMFVAGAARADLPSKLSDADFWSLSQTLSEPDGYFRSDNLLSNEMVFARVVPALVEATTPGGVYLGVGPEQNFTYIAAMRPAMVFITDVRRDNLRLHLMYKALFELSADRAEFVSRLFTKKRPAELSTSTTAGALMQAYWDIPTSDDATYARNLQEIKDLLTKTHRLPLDADDLAGVEKVYHAFYWYGPSITYSSSTAGVAARGTTYADLMMQVDANGHGLSYLASEEKFRVLKDLETRNLVVPVVGNFAGPKALRSVGRYLRDRGATVGAFYVSNVEQYLRQDGIWNTFCANVASMPLDEKSVFIRPSGSGASLVFQIISSPAATLQSRVVPTPMPLPAPAGRGGSTRSPLVPIADEVRGCVGG
jgi:hypothetical protein